MTNPLENYGQNDLREELLRRAEMGNLNWYFWEEDPEGFVSDSSVGFHIVHKRFWHRYHHPLDGEIEVLNGLAFRLPSEFSALGTSCYDYVPQWIKSNGAHFFRAIRKHRDRVRQEGLAALNDLGIDPAPVNPYPGLVHCFLLGDEKRHYRVDWICDTQEIRTQIMTWRNGLESDGGFALGHFASAEVYREYVQSLCPKLHLEIFPRADGAEGWAIKPTVLKRLPDYPMDPDQPDQPFFS